MSTNYFVIYNIKNKYDYMKKHLGLHIIGLHFQFNIDCFENPNEWKEELNNHNIFIFDEYCKLIPKKIFFKMVYMDLIDGKTIKFTENYDSIEKEIVIIDEYTFRSGYFR